MHIAVLFGGSSAERDVSIATATGVIRALRSRGHRVSALDLAHGPVSMNHESNVLGDDVPADPPQLIDGSPTGARAADVLAGMRDPLLRSDVVFIALHGGTGEDGTIQAYLSLLGAKYTGADALGSTLAMDKDVSKRLFRERGIATPEWLFNPTSADEVIAALGSEVVVKPNAQGSTIGLTHARGSAEIEAGLSLAREYGDVLVEKFIAGREMTVGVLDDRALALGEVIIPPHSTFSYEEKYQRGAVREVFPAVVEPSVKNLAQEIALSAHNALRIKGYSRSDFRLDGSGRLWLIEVNTLPGMTSTSLLPQSAAVYGIDYAELCERICAAAI